MMKNTFVAGNQQTSVSVRAQVMQPAARDPLLHQVRRQLLDSLPAATRVLQVGVDTDLAAAYRQRHPTAQWCSFDAHAPREELHESCDLIVISDGLQKVPDPLRLLRDLARLVAPNGTLLVSSPNAAQWSALQRLIETDLTRTGEGTWGSNTLHQFSASSLFKLQLDSGWMPHLASAVTASPSPAVTPDAALAIADAAGLPRAPDSRAPDVAPL